jgi:hypothetical protein
MSNNKSLWEDVREFKPERFLNDDGTFKKNENFLAFSAGACQCPSHLLFLDELFKKFKEIEKFQVRDNALENLWLGPNSSYSPWAFCRNSK